MQELDTSLKKNRMEEHLSYFAFPTPTPNDDSNHEYKLNLIIFVCFFLNMKYFYPANFGNRP